MAIHQVEGRLPRSAIVVRCHPRLFDAAVAVGRVGHARHLVRLAGLRPYAFDDHGRAVPAALEIREGAPGIEPGLPPLAFRRIPRIEAAAIAAGLQRHPVFPHGAARIELFDQAVSHLGVGLFGGKDLPLADPEVELVTFRTVAASWRRRWCGRLGRGQAGLEQQGQAQKRQYPTHLHDISPGFTRPYARPGCL